MTRPTPSFMNHSDKLDSDFEPVEPPNNVIQLESLREPEAESLKVGSLRPEQLTFDEIFKKIVFGDEVKLRFTYLGDYNSLRASLLRRYKGYQEIQLVLSRDKDEFLQCSCKRVGPKHQATHYEASFKIAPANEKKNGNQKKYEILRDL